MPLSPPAQVDPECSLALGYAEADQAPPLLALFALDTALGQILRTTRQPIVGQMRLTWWHDALTMLDTAAPPAEPILQGLAYHVLPRGITGTRLAAMIDGWEELLGEELLNDDAMMRYARGRGAALFAMAGVVIGAGQSDLVERAGEGWALADLARHLEDRADAGRVTALARPVLAQATRVRWSRPARPLGALAHLARMNLAVPLDQPLPVGAPGRVARLAWHRLTGR